MLKVMTDPSQFGSGAEGTPTATSGVIRRRIHRRRASTRPCIWIRPRRTVVIR